VGSGFSFHNLHAFFRGASPDLERSNTGFEEWLLETCSGRELSEEERERRLLGWESAPGARDCHPREEHLLPLHVCYGAARTPCYDAFELRIMGRKASIYLW
jgi:aromatic ring-opening dioxygenase catalytic subunit (LigB family)